MVSERNFGLEADVSAVVSGGCDGGVWEIEWVVWEMGCGERGSEGVVGFEVGVMVMVLGFLSRSPFLLQPQP